MGSITAYYHGFYVDMNLGITFRDKTDRPFPGVFEVTTHASGRRIVIRPCGFVFWNTIVSENPVFMGRDSRYDLDEIKIVKVSPEKTRIAFYTYMPVVGRTLTRLLHVRMFRGRIASLTAAERGFDVFPAVGRDAMENTEYEFIHGDKSTAIYCKANTSDRAKEFTVRSRSYSAGRIISVKVHTKPFPDTHADFDYVVKRVSRSRRLTGLIAHGAAAPAKDEKSGVMKSQKYSLHVKYHYARSGMTSSAVESHEPSVPQSRGCSDGVVHRMLKDTPLWRKRKYAKVDDKTLSVTYTNYTGKLAADEFVLKHYSWDSEDGSAAYYEGDSITEKKTSYYETECTGGFVTYCDGEKKWIRVGQVHVNGNMAEIAGAYAADMFFEDEFGRVEKIPVESAGRKIDIVLSNENGIIDTWCYLDGLLYCSYRVFRKGLTGLTRIKQDSSGRVVWVKNKKYCRRSGLLKSESVVFRPPDGKKRFYKKIFLRRSDGTFKRAVYKGSEGAPVNNRNGWAAIAASEISPMGYEMFDERGRPVKG